MTKKNAFSMLVALSVMLGWLAVAVPAFAKTKPVVVTAPSDAAFTRRVNYRDLDLAKLGDKKILLQRVRSAVTNVCLQGTGLGTQFYEKVTCRKDAWSDARPQIKLAVQRADEIAQFGSSAIPAVAISISFANR